MRRCIFHCFSHGEINNKLLLSGNAKMISVILKTIFLVIYLVLLVNGVEEQKQKPYFEEPDTSHWIDPTVKFSLKKSTKSVDNAETQSTHRRVTESDCRQYSESPEQRTHRELIMLRHVLRNFIVQYQKTGNTAEDFDVTLRLRRPQLEHFERLLDNPNVLHSQPVIDAWNDVLRTLTVQKEPTSIESVERRLGLRLDLVIQILLIFTLPFLIIYLEVKIGVSLLGLVRRIFQYILLGSFVVSFPWTWFRLYQEKVAEQQRVLLDKSQFHCEPLSAGQYLLRTFGNFFSMKANTSPCEQYYRAVNVHPFLDVPPTMAVVVTITTFVLEPLKHIGKAIGEFFQAVLAPLPFYMYPVVTAVIVLIAVLVIITRSNYEVHLPWFFAKIRPAALPAPTRPAISEKVRTKRGLSRLTDSPAESQRERSLEHDDSWREERPTPRASHGASGPDRYRNFFRTRGITRSPRIARQSHLSVSASRSAVDMKFTLCSANSGRSPSLPAMENDSSS